jgi:hypothetical protein
MLYYISGVASSLQVRGDSPGVALGDRSTVLKADGTYGPSRVDLVRIHLIFGDGTDFDFQV